MPKYLQGCNCTCWLQVHEAQSYIEKNLVPKVTAVAGVEHKIEICHFGTDTEAVGEARYCQACFVS